MTLETEAILKEHLGHVHEELGELFRDIEMRLDEHLARIETAITDALIK